MEQVLGKHVCRELLSDKMSAILPDKAILDLSISQNLINLIQQIYPEGFLCAGSFQPLSDEPKLRLPDEWSLSYPKVLGSIAMDFYKASNKDFVKGAFDISEPVGDVQDKVASQKHDFFIIPAVGYSGQGDRLGRGNGYYDNYLAEFKGIKIGVGYSASLATVCWVPEEHDVAVDYVVTENKIMKVL